MKQQRQTLTKESLKGALSQLLASKDFEAISISELCRTAGINRTTFYLHYVDKEDFVRTIKEEVIARLQETLTAAGADPQQALLEVIRYMYEDQPFFKIISRASFATWPETIKGFISGIVALHPKALPFIADTTQLPKDYAMEYFTGALEGMITAWIQKDQPEEPTAFMQMLLKVPLFSWWSE